MAKYQIKAVLLAPQGNYDEPNVVADYNALNKAWNEDNDDVFFNIIGKYEVENGAIEEHDNDADLIVDCDADGYYLLRKISE